MKRRENLEVNGGVPKDTSRTQWAKPELKRLDAGSAEATPFGPNPDFGADHS